MPLVPTALASSLAVDWLVAEGGEYPHSAPQSGDAFAAAVSSWFAAATAGPFPCATASARRPQLAASATGGDPGRRRVARRHAAGVGADGLHGGPGRSAPASPRRPRPSARPSRRSRPCSRTSSSQLSARANQIATGVHTLAISTIVVFPPVVSPADAGDVMAGALRLPAVQAPRRPRRDRRHRRRRPPPARQDPRGPVHRARRARQRPALRRRPRPHRVRAARRADRRRRRVPDRRGDAPRARRRGADRRASTSRPIPTTGQLLISIDYRRRTDRSPRNLEIVL